MTLRRHFPPLPLPPLDNPLRPDEKEQARLLRLTLPDATLTVAQQCAGKARHGRRETRTLWALVPGAVSTCIIVIRTALEDKTLHEELHGYQDYARRVRYRLVPGIW